VKAVDVPMEHELRSPGAAASWDALYRALGDTLQLLARRLDGLLLDAVKGEAGASPDELRGLRLLTTDALHTLRSVVDADEARRFGAEGIDRALRRIVDDFAASTGSIVDVRVRGDMRRVNPAVAHVVLGVARETFSNISRHARATIVVLSLAADRDRVVLDVVDDGVDLPQRQVVAWGSAVDLGLQRMARAVRSVGGRLVVSAALPRGIRLRVTVPLLPGAGS
jgi:signal transduction histidine kinase